MYKQRCTSSQTSELLHEEVAAIVVVSRKVEHIHSGCVLPLDRVQLFGRGGVVRLWRRSLPEPAAHVCVAKGGAERRGRGAGGTWTTSAEAAGTVQGTYRRGLLGHAGSVKSVTLNVTIACDVIRLRPLRRLLPGTRSTRTSELCTYYCSHCY